MGAIKDTIVNSRDDYYESLPFLQWETPGQRGLTGPHEESELYMVTGADEPYKIAVIKDKEWSTEGDNKGSYRLDFSGTVLAPYLKSQRYPPVIYRDDFLQILDSNTFESVDEAKSVAMCIAGKILPGHLADQRGDSNEQ